MLSRRGTLTTFSDSASHDLKIRVRYGEGPLEGASTIDKYGCALQPKDSSCDVPRIAQNVEIVKGTTSKDTGELNVP